MTYHTHSTRQIIDLDAGDPSDRQPGDVFVWNPDTGQWEAGRRNFWKGEWAAGEYLAFDQVEDEGWLMIANKTTTDRAAPQPVGLPKNVYVGLDPTNSATAKQIIFGNRYTNPTLNFQISVLRVYTVIGNTYTLYAVEDPLGTPIINQIIQFTGSVDGWSEINYNPSIVPVGSTFDIVAVVQEPDPTPTVISADWNYTTPNNEAAPGTGVIIHAGQLLDSFRINKTPSAGSADLSTLTEGDVIEGAGVRWAIQNIVDNGTWWDFTVAPAQQGSPEGVQTFNFETVTATPITYLEDVDYWLTSPFTAQGLFIADGDYSNIVPNDTAYGVDLLFQEVASSPDWDFQAVSGGGGAATTRLNRAEISWVQASAQLIDQTKVTTSGNTWTELLRFAVQPGEALVASLVVEGFRQDAFDIFYQEVRVVTTNDGGLVTTITPIIEQSPHPQVESRYQGSGNEVVLEVRGRSGQDWKWKCTVFFNHIDP